MHTFHFAKYTTLNSNCYSTELSPPKPASGCRLCRTPWWTICYRFSSVQFSSKALTLCDPMNYSSLSIPTPRAYSSSCPSRWWCHPTISSSVIPFSSRLQSFLASRSFQMSQFFASGGQSIWSFSFSISPSNEYSGLISFRIDWFDLLAV